MELFIKLPFIQPIPFSIILVTTVSIVLLYSVFFWVTDKKKKRKKAPNAAGAWPLIGHLRLLMNDKEPLYRALGSMADKYGPAFNIRLGNQEVLVVSNWEMVKQCFGNQNDKLFSNRQTTLAAKYMLNQTTSSGFAPYGPYWRELRKIMVQQLLSKQSLESWKHLKIKEMDASFSKLNELCNNNGTGTATLIRMDEWFAELTFNVIARNVFGYQSGGRSTALTNGDTESKGERYKKTLEEALHLMSIFAVSDIFPSLEWVDRLRGLIRNMKRFGDELNSIAGCLIEEHRQKRLQSVSKSDKGVGDEQDFVDVLLSVAEKSQLPGDDPDLVIKSMILEIVSGGSETTSSTLTWALCLLLNHPHVLKKAKEELDTHVGKDRHVEESDTPKLVYINAIIKESMRLYPNGAMLDRLALEECEVGGFHVPAGGRLFVNVWKIQRDPSVWENPLEFKPERWFLSNGEKMDVDYKGHNHEFIPFGIGRRMCAGMLWASEVIHLVLPRLIHGFDMKAASANGKVDMAEMAGMVICFKKTPLEVMVNPRE
ncbi:hypothetical protein C5167_047516 [Papaver somniferum]|uniref:(13S,14R)-13-O-acetyl-1-hydroxy-N-methylcanadine 8-hydroxylase CYP82X1 n=2 Tax=Papaver somniferum TaxID=3469 RepID=C82X1_PAPSO|nr:(13S,14R)-13-O-acetyl-1-hydroxy-N-methylcanadine 8-hydroxylase CYP82X1 [Papaver somniferum]I3V6B7.1 RecName: Full=(13S,14R)-13-O-acetyl-1-hydroxy-N-methylcanadine 8-hydroxylase CYP82X1; AltName: Full=Cytochrome P450 82X1 [Papaver somniferum]AFB74614.1 cytochrome P450 [Papaver somniferum]AFK73719.1 cytochrome P450 [Papaver somniferum]RZC84729.1 hypothetical protein C5167_047516 [Papaver somniferum]